jgi:tRNA/rRNA methyltransferase
MASGAGRLLDEAIVDPDTATAVAGLQRVYATTARPRDATKAVLTPEAAAIEMAGLVKGGARVGVLLGPERTGLERDDVTLADVIVTAPTNPACPSINLAQAALLMAYEYARVFDATPPVAFEADLATGAETAAMLDHLTAELDRSGFFWPAAKRPSMEENLRNLFHRAPLTAQDVRTLRGVIRALAEGPRRRRTDGGLAAEDCPDMAALRVEIDRTDRALMRLFAERAGYIDRAAAIKAGNGLPARIPDRVEEVVARVRAAAGAEGLDADLFERLWRLLIEAAIAREEALLGREG